LVNKDRGEARKILKREALGLAQPPMALEWAKDFLAKTGGDRESGIDAWMPDSPEWEVAEQPIEDFMAEAATTAKETALKRRLEAEAEMLGWTEEAANALAIANGDQPLSAKKGSGAKDGKNNNDDNDYDKEGGQWVKEYREKFPGYPVPPDKHVEDELLEMGEDPPLLKPNRKGDLIKWLLTKLHVHLFKQGEKRGTSHLVLEYQLDEDAQAEAASRVQGLQRMYAARVRLRQITMRSYEKRFDRDAQRYFYVFAPTERARHSAESPWQWRKPKCFEYKRLSLDCPMPVDEWRDMYTHATEDELRRLSSDRPALRNTVVTLDTTGTSQEDGPPVTSKYYFNCATGQYSKLTVDEAAARLQGMVRDFQLRDIGKITMRQMIKAVKLQNDSEEKYEAFPHRLSSLVNWAMVLHTMHHDVDGAKRLYKEATEISEENPVLLRAYALLILLTCEPPRNISWQRAMGMLRAAEIRDPDREKFKVSEDALFHWAVICNPKNGRCLLNYALLLQCVIKDYDLAEKFYRRAVAADPDDKFVVRNYNDFEAQRLPGGMYEGGGPALAVLKTSALQEERFEWAEWAFLRNDRAHDERFKLFWAAESLGKTSWEEPKWHEVWAIVLKRSSLTKDLGKWREYYDPKLKRAFFTNRHMYDAEHVDSPEIKYQKLSPYNTGDMKMAQGE
jgi:tetratricopeptide (TPR) repeat protein